MKRMMKAAAVLAAGTATLIATAGGALADTTATTGPVPAASTASTSPAPTGQGKQTLAQIQAKAAAAISARQASLNAAISLVNANQVITSADKTTLLATLNADLSGLTALRATIAADTTAAQARTDYQKIFTDYRVYWLVLPQVHYAAAADDITTAVLPRLTDAQTKLAALLAGPDAAKNTPAVQAAMTDLVNQIAAATTVTTGLSATVLAYTPAQVNANHNLMRQARQTLQSARTDIKAARADVATIAGALK